ncbi:hypothetical protein Bhyg_00444 [Pseudolycoriella hygida]|uniref:Secreted protein n=1 Tax=Pseudolycoriella hygida TaxID=35572 RepID=A0A9Q0N7R4_9DIPT|nr:hypothetical protein Bhyg_00444 [Pseudolycoriella hygida]
MYSIKAILLGFLILGVCHTVVNVQQTAFLIHECPTKIHFTCDAFSGGSRFSKNIYRFLWKAFKLQKEVQTRANKPENIP